MVKYYYIGADNESHGPIDPSQFTTHGLTADSMVCPVGGQEWVRLADIPGLADYIGTPVTANRVQQPVPPSMQQIPATSSHMVWAILTTIFCCLPFGIVAIVYASKVNPLWTSGDYIGATKASKKAASWSIASAALSLVGCIIYAIIFALGIVSL